MKLIFLVNQYINYRKSLGEKFLNNGNCLKYFCRTMGKDIELSHVSVENVKKFLYGNGPVTSNLFFKHGVLVGFYHYVINRGYLDNSPLPKFLPKKPPSFIPYIYSREELRCLFKAALIKQKREIEPYMVRIILILLYSTGLRLSELLSLTMSDVNLSQSIITVHQTKFYKDRLVPLGKQLTKLLTAYIKWRKNHGGRKDQSAPFIITKTGNFVTVHHMEVIYRRIRNIANIHRSDKARYQPRLHDLRHTFAVHRLISWYRENKNIQELLPLLSVYMGHTCIAHTSVYLTMTADLLHEAGVRFEQYAMGGVR